MGTVIKLANRLAAKNKHEAVIRLADRLIEESKEDIADQIQIRFNKLDELYLIGSIDKASFDLIESRLINALNRIMEV